MTMAMRMTVIVTQIDKTGWKEGVFEGLCVSYKHNVHNGVS